MVENYHNYPYWDIRGTVRGAIRRAAFMVMKGPEEKENIIQSTDRLLSLIDDEENFQKNAHIQNVAPTYQ
jgi:hypothetical protein